MCDELNLKSISYRVRIGIIEYHALDHILSTKLAKAPSGFI